ncbi:MAG: ABC transporter permease [Kineosporiaceae bacterium]
MTTTAEAAPSRGSQFTGTVHVYEPHRAGLPKLGPYVRELWQRREFATEMSRASIRAANTRTVFGQIWLMLNPLLLAAVYLLLVNVLSPKAQGMDYFAHLTAGLFTYYFISGCMSTGAGSVVGGGKLLMNTAFPRLLLPLSAVRTAFYRYLPTLPVFGVFYLLSPSHVFTWRTLLVIPFLMMIIIFSCGLAAIFATLQVYFRDTASFLPYFVRIWLYLSPVIFTMEQLRQHAKGYVHLLYLNPLYSLLGGFTQTLVQSRVPALNVWLAALAWTVVTAVLGAAYLMSRERDFAVRI